MIGRTLSHYKVLAEIRRGGMGIVYRALDVKLEREVALKVLAPALLGDSELRRRFVQEARALAALSHPHIAVVHEIDEAEDTAFIAMELIEGEPLSDRLARGALEVSPALELAAEAAGALAAAHRKGIVHRDFKPANLIVTEAGHAKVVDFGLAKLLDPLGDLGNQVVTPRHGTDPGRLVGTPAYMSPEQARGDRLDTRTDVFSFGSVLYEMLTGEGAFRRDTAVETLHAIMKEAAPVPSLPRSAGAAAPRIARLIESCLAKRPEDRPASMEAVAAELGEARRDLLVEDASGRRPADPPRPLRAEAARRLRVVLVDDEALGRDVLREYLTAHREVEIVAECANGFEAVKAAAERRPDLLLLDVQMPKLDGFEVLQLIDRAIGVVFVTAYDEFALKAFDVNAIDYLLKPVSPERLAEALARARRRLDAREPLPVEALARAVRRTPHDERILVRQGADVHVIPVARLDFAQAQDDYVNLRSEGKDYLKEQTLAQLEAALDPARFVRIHRSYLLNVERLAKVELYAKDSRLAILRDGTRLPLSRAGYARLKELL